jgi:hypothetical protein
MLNKTFLLGFPTGCFNIAPSKYFSGTVAGEEEDFCKGSLSRTIFYFVFVLLYFIFACIVLLKIQKNSSLIVVTFTYLLFSLARMSKPEAEVRTFKQQGERV